MNEAGPTVTARPGGSCLAASSSLPIACDLGVLTAEDREAQVRGLDGGWELHFDAAALADVSPWFLDERRGCSFLTLQIDLPTGADRIAVRLPGPAGTNELLQAVAEEMGIRLS